MKKKNVECRTKRNLSIVQLDSINMTSQFHFQIIKNFTPKFFFTVVDQLLTLFKFKFFATFSISSDTNSIVASEILPIQISSFPSVFGCISCFVFIWFWIDFDVVSCVYIKSTDRNLHTQHSNRWYVSRCWWRLWAYLSVSPRADFQFSIDSNLES